jgi:hypothetical protein
LAVGRDFLFQELDFLVKLSQQHSEGINAVQACHESSLSLLRRLLVDGLGFPLVFSVEGSLLPLGVRYRHSLVVDHATRLSGLCSASWTLDIPAQSTFLQASGIYNIAISQVIQLAARQKLVGQTPPSRNSALPKDIQQQEAFI